MKKVMVFGVEMSDMERMKFDKYINNKGIAMNTFLEKDRTKLAGDWLQSQEEKDIKQERIMAHHALDGKFGNEALIDLS